MKLPEIKISYDKGNFPRHKITSSRKIAELVKGNFNQGTFDYSEEFLAVYLNANNETIGVYRVSTGGIDVSIVDVRVVYAVALQCGASGVIFAHNHPSGNPRPSEADKIVTDKLTAAGKILGIAVLDHVILGGEDYRSFADMELI